MPRDYIRKPGTRAYKNYTDETLQAILAEIKSGRISVRGAAEKYGIHRNTLSSKLKGKAPLKPGGQPVFSESEEQGFISHIVALSSFGFPITPTELRVIAKTYLDKRGRKVNTFINNYPGKEWAHSFLKRHKSVLSHRIARNITHGRAEINEMIVNEFFDNFEKETEGVPDTNIWNYDETCLVDDPGSVKVLVRRGTKYPEIIRNSSKASTSIMICGSAAGELAPVYVVYKAENMWETWTENGPEGARYNRTKSGWFDARCFEDWFHFTMLPILKKQSGKKVLVGDNLSSHINREVMADCEANNIAFICLPPNATHLLQPLDVAYFRPMKIAWRNTLNEWKNNVRGSRSSSVPKDHFPGLLKEMFQKMETNSAQNLKSGFKKCGLIPHNRDEVLRRLPDRQLEENVPVQELLGGSFIEHLKATRLQVTETRQCRRRKRVNVPPGRGITTADLQHDMEVQLAPSTPLFDEGSDAECDANSELAVERAARSNCSTPVQPYSHESPFLSFSTHEASPIPCSSYAVSKNTTLPLHDPTSEQATEKAACSDCSTPTHISTSPTPHCSKYALNEITEPRSVKESEINSEPQPYTSKTSERQQKKNSFSASTAILINKRKKSIKKVPKSCLKKEKYNQDSEDSCDSYMSLQESDASLNWYDLEDSEKENDNNTSTEIQFEDNKMDLTKLKEGHYVQVEYENNLYPGKVIRILNDSALISAMAKSGYNTWKWPKPADIIWYHHSKIRQVIKEPKSISKRGLFKFS